MTMSSGGWSTLPSIGNHRLLGMAERVVEKEEGEAAGPTLPVADPRIFFNNEVKSSRFDELRDFQKVQVRPDSDKSCVA